MLSCFFCGKDITEPGYITRHQGRYFCSDLCCAKQLLEDADDEIEWVWFDTPENIELCAKEEDDF